MEMLIYHFLALSFSMKSADYSVYLPWGYLNDVSLTAIITYLLCARQTVLFQALEWNGIKAGTANIFVKMSTSYYYNSK